jgi:hypothetical protein
MSKGRFVDIFVEPDSNEPSGYKFSMEEDRKGTSILVFNKDVDKMKKSEDYKIEFKLHNRRGADLVFSKDKDNVLWAMAIPEPSEACPPPGSKFPGLYVDPTSYILDDRLTVINEDKTVQHFAFALNFIPRGVEEGPDTKYVCYDPVGSNQDGGRTPMLPQFRTSTVIGVAAVVIVIIALLSFTSWGR